MMVLDLGLASYFAKSLALCLVGLLALAALARGGSSTVLDGRIE